MHTDPSHVLKMYYNADEKELHSSLTFTDCTVNVLPHI